MCGLVGVAGNLNSATSKAFRTLLFVDQFRGMHSTGVIKLGYSKETPPIIDKEIGEPNVLCATSNLFDAKGIPHTPGRAWFGHNRYATLGAVTKENAHPFQFGDVYGMHNGTLDDYDKLHGADTYPVDSMALLSNINEHGIRDTWSKFYGAAALTWYDRRDDTINLIRNKRRPLHIAYNEAKDVLFWASEAWMIRAAAGSANIKLGTFDDEEDVIQLKENFLHSYKATATSISLSVVEEVEEAKYPRPFSGYYNGYSYVPKVGYKGPKQTEKKEEKGKAQTSPVTVGSSSLLTGLTVDVPSDLRKNLNQGWAGDYIKAPKDTLGLKVKLHYAQRIYRASHTDLFCLRGTGLEEYNGKRVQVTVFPENYKLWQKWCKLANLAKYEENIYQIVRRPRFYSENSSSVNFAFSANALSLFNGITFTDYKEPSIPSQAEIIPLVRGRDGSMVTEDEFREQVDIAGGCCICGGDIHPDQADNVDWYNTHVVACPECRSNELWHHYVGGVC